MAAPVMMCEEMEEPARKRFCPDYLSAGFVYGSVSSSNADTFDDDDKESVYSWQSYETAWVADSGDDWSETEDDENSLTEFELAEEETVEEESHYTTDSSTTADVKDIHFPEGLLPSPATDSSSFFSDESGWDDHNGETDGCFGSSTKSQSSWNCLKCRAPTAAPRNFCFTCYQKRKSSRPPRPARRLKKSGRTKTSGSPLANDCATMLISPPGTSNSDNMCTVCHVQIRDGAFVHRKTAHVACCFSCTEKISKNRNAKCPICRQSIQSTIKIFFN